MFKILITFPTQPLQMFISALADNIPTPIRDTLYDIDTIL